MSWGILEQICDRFHVSPPSWIISCSELKEAETEAGTKAETVNEAEVEAGAGAVAEAVRQIIL